MKNKLNTLIIDHSPTQRRLISHLARHSSDLDPVYEIENKHQITRISEMMKYDLILMDIEFPGLEGIEFSQLLDSGVQIILVTATPTYALRAFELGVTDYLIKPVQQRRFRDAISKATRHFSILKDPHEVEDFIQVKSDHDYKKIALSQIRWIEALGDYVKIITNSERILVLSTLSSIEEQLPVDKFLRIHRSYIVNLKKVENFSSTSVEVEGMNLPMSRKRKSRLEAKLIPDLES